MDLPYSQQQQARRKNRSAANLQHLTLAPLTTRLPLRDDFDGSTIIESHAYFATASASASANGNTLARIPSYIHGRSAPTTPRLLSKSPPALTPSRSRSHEGRRAMAGHRAAGTGGSSGSSNNNQGHTTTLPKSRSTTHLLAARYGGVAGTETLGSSNVRHLNGTRHHRRRKTDHYDRSSGDWLFRAGVLVISEARESKGQSWLTARASSTSLTGLRDTEEAEDVAAFERELAREREYLERIAGSSRHGSRRGSLDHDLVTPGVRASTSRPGSGIGSRASSHLGSRANSRAHSRVSSRVQMFTPMERHSLDHNGIAGEPSSAMGGYFDYAGFAEDDEYYDGSSGMAGAGRMTPVGPDFVNLDEKLEAVKHHQRDSSLEDEDHVRRLVKREKAGGVMGSWLGSVFGWSLFSVQENEDEGVAGEEADEEEEEEAGEEEDGDDDDDEDDDEAEAEIGEAGIDREAGVRERGIRTEGQPRRRRAAVGWNQSGSTWSCRPHFEGVVNQTEDRVPPPPRADEGTWQDAAWLLSVASKVIL